MLGKADRPTMGGQQDHDAEGKLLFDFKGLVGKYLSIKLSIGYPFYNLQFPRAAMVLEVDQPEKLILLQL